MKSMELTTEMEQDTALYDDKAMTPESLREHVTHIQKIMKSVMKEGAHYGTIPGTKKPGLWKPGAEILQLTFGISISVEIEDKSTEDAVRIRVKATATHRKNGTVLGSAYGEASSNEEKYKWRAAVCQEEFNKTPELKKRVKYKRKYKSKEIEKVNQVKTEPADIANTVLKMAEKRAVIGITIRVTAASDVFDQSEYDDNGSAQSGNGQTSQVQSHPKDVSQPKPYQAPQPQYQQAPSPPDIGSGYLSYANGVFFWTGPIETKEIPKGAGMRWNADYKKWQTEDFNVAKKLAEYADSAAQAQMTEVPANG